MPPNLSGEPNQVVPGAGPPPAPRPPKSRTPLYAAIAVAVALTVVVGALALGGVFSPKTKLGSGGGGGGGSNSAPLAVSDSASQPNGPHPLADSFSSSVSGGNPPYSYLWHLGDGTTSTAATASDTYPLRGTYTVGLTVTDSSGSSKDAAPLQIGVDPVLSTGTSVSSTTENVGVGVSGALIIPFTVPTVGSAPNAINTSLSGYVAITACGVFCTNLLAYVIVATPSEAQNIVNGGAVQVIWCYTAGGSTCQAEQNTQISLDLTSHSGQTVDLLIYNTNITVGQTATVKVSTFFEA